MCQRFQRRSCSDCRFQPAFAQVSDGNAIDRSIPVCAINWRYNPAYSALQPQHFFRWITAFFARRGRDPARRRVGRPGTLQSPRTTSGDGIPLREGRFFRKAKRTMSRSSMIRPLAYSGQAKLRLAGGSRERGLGIRSEPGYAWSGLQTMSSRPGSTGPLHRPFTGCTPATVCRRSTGG